MKYTQVRADTFSRIQLNAGVLLSDFDTSTGAIDRTKILGATGGGVTFNASHEFVDFGDGIDNMPKNTMQLKRLQGVTATISGTFKEVDTTLSKSLIGAADISSGKVTPRADLLQTDFDDIWWVGDYSDVNADSGSGSSVYKAGYIAIKLLNALSTGGFQIKSNDKGKGDFPFTYTGHYDIDSPDTIPYEIYIADGVKPSS